MEDGVGVVNAPELVVLDAVCWMELLAKLIVDEWIVVGAVTTDDELAIGELATGELATGELAIDELAIDELVATAVAELVPVVGVGELDDDGLAICELVVCVDEVGVTKKKA
jgi:hypothetical protein